MEHHRERGVMEVICLIGNKMKSIKYHTVGTFPKSNKNNLRNRNNTFSLIQSTVALEEGLLVE
jgi:hypothetical protein